jgi:hypothetical protein
MAALDLPDLPDDKDFREAVRSRMDFGPKVAIAEVDERLHPLREVARWTWPGDDDGTPAHETVRLARARPNPLPGLLVSQLERGPLVADQA